LENFSRPLRDEYACDGADQAGDGREDFAVPSSEISHVKDLEGGESDEAYGGEVYHPHHMLAGRKLHFPLLCPDSFG